MIFLYLPWIFRSFPSKKHWPKLRPAAQVKPLPSDSKHLPLRLFTSGWLYRWLKPEMSTVMDNNGILMGFNGNSWDFNGILMGFNGI